MSEPAIEPPGPGVPGCFACDLSAGRRPLPGGLISASKHWRVEHCVGPLGVGTLLVKPTRHVTRVAELTSDEAREMGPLLRRAAGVVDRLVEPDQTYVCLWSHAGGEPVHIHYVVQPVTRSQMDAHGRLGPHLQGALFDAGVAPDPELVAAFAERARAAFAEAEA